ncbi:uncharacterized protein A4U43_C04F4260 [Asparagus officinalis]|uniref:Bulb-type lectin domain-containing protein n=1 Tax=Asparagus officinalis TaxID=4686 RepID=A0A5P1F0W6_ASPOF|nr:uncharacterized protein LOC109838172 [Asparagus officinalis]ONK71057.1 uncharacterized protein A4U43_C04F4260 [Asparagus officinalis]
MMRPPPLYIHLFVLLFAGFLISGALTPSISDELIGNSDGLKSSSPSPSPSTALDLSAARSSSRKLLDSDGNKYDRLLLARSDGTIYFVDRQSMVPLWKFVTGSPILYSKQADPDVEYFIDFGANGQLYEYSKAFGRRVCFHISVISCLSDFYSYCRSSIDLCFPSFHATDLWLQIVPVLLLDQKKQLYIFLMKQMAKYSLGITFLLLRQKAKCPWLKRS